MTQLKTCEYERGRFGSGVFVFCSSPRRSHAPEIVAYQSVSREVELIVM